MSPLSTPTRVCMYHAYAMCSCPHACACLWTHVCVFICLHVHVCLYAVCVRLRACPCVSLCSFWPPASQVYTYEGLCEQFTYQKPANPLEVDSSMQARYPRAVPWLKPSPMTMATPQDRFQQQFFLATRTGGHTAKSAANRLKFVAV